MTALPHSNEVWVPDQGDGTFINPIIHADYSDPDVVRVGEDFYMTASSFAHAPALPILHSKDLVNWTIINYVRPTLELAGYETPQHGKGVWAPSIRYHDGKFWVFFGAPDEGIYMSTATDPAGEWTPLHCVKEVIGWIDTCPFWDDDGQAYLVHAFANSRCGIKHKLKLCRMSPDGKQLLDEGEIIFDGTEEHPTMEGPKMYKRNGWYYIFAPAGGVATGWQTILRSRNIYGPYEDKIVLHQGDSPVNGPHQGGWVELESGESWFVHFQDHGAYGRIVHLQPVEWVDDWPLMGIDTNGDGIGEPVLRHKKPNVGREYPIAVPVTTDEFEGVQLGLQWQWQANPQHDWASLSERAGWMRLYSRSIPDGGSTLYDASQLLMQKFPALEFKATTKLELHSAAAGDEAGLVVYGDQYSSLTLRRTQSGAVELVRLAGEKQVEQTVWSADADAAAALNGGAVYLRVAVSGEAECTFSYSVDGESYTVAGPAFTAQKGRWVGAKTGIYAMNRSASDSAGYADFDWFRVEKV